MIPILIDATISETTQEKYTRTQCNEETKNILLTKRQYSSTVLLNYIIQQIDCSIKTLFC